MPTCADEGYNATYFSAFAVASPVKVTAGPLSAVVKLLSKYTLLLSWRKTAISSPACQCTLVLSTSSVRVSALVAVKLICARSPCGATFSVSGSLEHAAAVIIRPAQSNLIVVCFMVFLCYGLLPLIVFFLEIFMSASACCESGLGADFEYLCLRNFIGLATRLSGFFNVFHK